MADRYWQVVLQDGKDLPDAIWRCGGVKIRRCLLPRKLCAALRQKTLAKPLAQSYNPTNLKCETLSILGR